MSIKLSITTSQKTKSIVEWLKKIGIDSDIINGYDTVTIEFTEDDIKQLPSNKDKVVDINISDIKADL
jgi:hypothetical protein